MPGSLPLVRRGFPIRAILLAAAIMISGPAKATGAIDSPAVAVDSVRFACSFATEARAASIPGTAKFCDMARTALSDLAAGHLEEPVTRLPAWAAILNPDAEQDCRDAAGVKAAASCDRARFRLVHRAEPLPIVPVDLSKAAIAEPGAVTAIVKGQGRGADTAFDAREVRISLKIIAVADNAQRDVELFQEERVIKIEQGTGAGDSLRAGLQLLWASYFTPFVLNHMMSNALTVKAHRPTTTK